MSVGEWLLMRFFRRESRAAELDRLELRQRERDVRVAQLELQLRLRLRAYGGGT